MNKFLLRRKAAIVTSSHMAGSNELEEKLHKAHTSTSPGTTHTFESILRKYVSPKASEALC